MTSASARTPRRVPRRALVLVGVLVAALAIGAGTALLVGSGGEPPVDPPSTLSAKVGLRDGQWAHRRADVLHITRSGRVSQRYGVDKYVSTNGVVRTLASYSPHCFVVDGPGRWTLAYFARLPTNDLRRLGDTVARVGDHRPSDAQKWAMLGDLGDYGGLQSPRLRAALAALASRLSGVTVHRHQRDYLGRPAIRLERPGGDENQYLFFDPTTYRLVEQLATYPARGSKQITVVRRDDVVDRLPARLPQCEGD